MDNSHLRRAILQTIESWKNLAEKQKGQNFQDSVDRLTKWAEELKKNE